VSNVVGIESARPHLSGPCRCVDCKHEWVGVAPVGTYAMTCPACGADKGGRFAMIIPDEGVPMWRCKCGNCFMVLMRDCWMCPNCGEQQRFE